MTGAGPCYSCLLCSSPPENNAVPVMSRISDVLKLLNPFKALPASAHQAVLDSDRSLSPSESSPGVAPLT